MERIALLLLVALLWSPTFMLIKIGLREVPPLSFTFLRIFFGLLILLLFYPRALHGVKSLVRQHWGLLLISSALNIAIPFALCNFGEYYVESSVAGIIEGCVPAFTVLIGICLGRGGDRNRQLVSLPHLLAIFLGFAGTVLIFAPEISSKQWGSAQGVALLVVMAITFAAGFVFYERKLRDLPFASVLAVQLGIAAAFLLPLACWYEPDFSFLSIDVVTCAALVVLGFTGTSIGLLMFYTLLARHGAQFASLVTYLCLVLAIFWGVCFLDERFTLATAGGALLIVVSMACASTPVARGSKDNEELLRGEK
jgi:drug/metabolite transporter (DMT)-like permease